MITEETKASYRAACKEVERALGELQEREQKKLRTKTALAVYHAAQEQKTILARLIAKEVCKV